MTGEGLSFKKWAKYLTGPTSTFQDYMLGSALYVFQAQGIAPEIAYEYLRNLTFYLRGEGTPPNPPQPMQEAADGKQGSGLWTPGQHEGVAEGHGRNPLWVPGKPRG